MFICMFKSDSYIFFPRISLKEEGFCVCDGSNLFVPFIIATTQASAKGYIKPFLASLETVISQQDSTGKDVELDAQAAENISLGLKGVRKTHHEAGSTAHSCTANDTKSLNPAFFLH